jgi:hypothetical protein
VTSEELESKKFELDQEIRRAEIALRENELQVRKDEVAAQHRLTDAQVSQSKYFKWTNPATVALVGALIALIGNVMVSYRSTGSAERVALENNRLQKQISDSTMQNNVALEHLKDEAGSIVEVIKDSGGDQLKVKAGICMLLKLNTLKSESTVKDALNYVNNLGGCETQAEKVPQEQWLPASLAIPGCGESGCYLPYSVCGLVPANMRATGNTRGFGDTFAGAWGDWQGPAAVLSKEGSDYVCRTFMQHSHNVARSVSFQFEVKPK